MPHDVFISHSSADKRAADATRAILEGRGIKCWIAPRDIRPGSDGGESIVSAIEQSNGTYTLTTGLASASGNYQFEGPNQFLDTQAGNASVWRRAR